MVEGERPRPVTGIEDDRRLRVVGAAGPAGGPGQEDRRDRVKTRVSRRVGVGAELPDELDVEGCLLASLPDRGRLERLAVIDEAAGQGPAGGRVLALDEDDAAAPAAVHDLDDDVDRRERVPVLRAGHGRFDLRDHCSKNGDKASPFSVPNSAGRPRTGTVSGGFAGSSGRLFGIKNATIMDVNRSRMGDRP